MTLSPNVRRANVLAAAGLLLALVPYTLASAGIIELGRKGQLAGGSTFTVIVEGRTFSEGSHIVTENVASIAEKVRANIDASPFYTATIPDPTNNPTNITILRETGIEPYSLEVFISDPNIGGAFVDAGSLPSTSGTFQGANAIAHNGNFEIDVTVFCPGMPPMVFTHVVSTAPATKTVADVNAEMVALLRASGFSVSGPTLGNTYTLYVQSNQRLQRIEMNRTDTGITTSGVGETTQSQANVPTLSEWGLVFLAALVALGGALLLRPGSPA
ncbi:MAG: IPTL-CTERM sorting domain-containing protein [Acidobacteria bacterium]|nr:IPTL-CTERM sorting domain-containing protein [Acidobacteriota bacterium]